MRTLAVWLGSVSLVLMTLAIIAGLGFYKYNQLQAAMNMPPPPEQPVTVVMETAGELTFRNHTTMIGTVLSPRSIVLSNEIAGTVSAIHFEPGQIVDRNQVLVELDTSVERAQLEAAKARQKIAESAHKRISEAATSRAVTASELDEAIAQLDQATAEVAELEAVINRKTLRAPFRGKVGLADTHQGQFLPSGFNIASLQGIEDYIYVDFMIPQSATESVRVGDQVQLLAQSQSLVGEVIALDSQANRDSRNLMARARIANPPPSLLPGDSVKVLVEYGDEITAAAVSPEALRSAPMETLVYVIETDKEGAQRAYPRQVVPGPTIDGRLTILSGLQVGQLVSADGSFKLRDGALVVPPLPDEAEESPATDDQAKPSEAASPAATTLEVH